jgi:hypothetical protein
MATIATESRAVQELIDREAIRDLVLCYSRGVDKFDIALLRDLYTEDGTDTHGDTFDGPADAFCDFLEQSLPHGLFSGHSVCNHMIGIDGDIGEGEVYALSTAIIPDMSGGNQREEDFMFVRYIDNYRRCDDGKWRFSKRVVTYDVQFRRPFNGGGTMNQGANDPSYRHKLSLFQRGARK